MPGIFCIEEKVFYDIKIQIFSKSKYTLLTQSALNARLIYKRERVLGCHREDAWIIRFIQEQSARREY